MLRGFRSVARPSLARAAAPVARRQAHAISNPTLVNLESRWEAMSEEERSDIVAQLAERQKGSWAELTVAEKRAAWYISYGAWGPRKPIHAPGDAGRIVKGIAAVILGAATLFTTIRLLSPSLPHTMNKEWQEAANEKLAEKNANPFTGYNQVQSPSKGPSDDDE
ncbi:cytochrome c oxidase subunit Va [Sugiyamaella lignohabitans]|uniref:Cytochrome c oxidase subunit Va n=1 Tax=Sugiyamaella lignohabitans TaxID=796027 RepID=A0A167ECI6_9ASCO|nr:cytochrome c oxidase subunit Va [Sugiyamaella lignohabitans]ANB13906.1 cytochrome c oxidase subunit Va [Sugiyamaella lignohabitans]